MPAAKGWPVDRGHRRGAAGFALAGMVVGTAASIAANIAHSYVPPAHTAPGWAPPVGAVIAGAFWPLCLLLAVEVLTRVRWPAGRWWALARYGGVVLVSLVAALVSYLHMSALLGYYRENTLTVYIGPLAVDGLMIVAGVALLTLGLTGKADHERR